MVGGVIVGFVGDGCEGGLEGDSGQESDEGVEELVKVLYGEDGGDYVVLLVGGSEFVRVLLVYMLCRESEEMWIDLLILL